LGNLGPHDQPTIEGLSLRARIEPLRVHARGASGALNIAEETKARPERFVRRAGQTRARVGWLTLALL
jgi:hypothetical protein